MTYTFYVEKLKMCLLPYRKRMQQ